LQAVGLAEYHGLISGSNAMEVLDLGGNTHSEPTGDRQEYQRYIIKSREYYSKHDSEKCFTRICSSAPQQYTDLSNSAPKALINHSSKRIMQEINRLSKEFLYWCGWTLKYMTTLFFRGIKKNQVACFGVAGFRSDNPPT
jgi:hypothetical protein